MSGGCSAIFWRSSWLSWPGVAGVGDRFLPDAVAIGQKLLEFLQLAITQRIHRIDDNGADARAGIALTAAAQDIVDDGDKIGEGFAGPGAGRQHIALAALGGVDGVLLMLVQTQRFANILGRLLRPKDAAAFRVQEPGIHEVFNGAAGDEVGIELHQRRRPEVLGLVGRVQELRDIVRPDAAEAPREAFVVGNDVLPKGKDIHGAILYCPWAAVVGGARGGSGSNRVPCLVTPNTARSRLPATIARKQARCKTPSSDGFARRSRPSASHACHGQACDAIASNVCPFFVPLCPCPHAPLRQNKERRHTLMWTTRGNTL